MSRAWRPRSIASLPITALPSMRSAVLVSAVVALVIATLVTIPEAQTASEVRPPTSGGRLVAGAASVVIDVPAGTPLAGYGSAARRLLVPDLLGRHPHAFWFRPHAGVHEPLRARALVLDGGATRVVWITVDLIAIDRRFTDDVRRRLGADARTTLMISASHTHSGPGAFIDSALMAFVAVDRLDPDAREAIIAAVVEAVTRADRAKTRARLGTSTVPGPELTVSRLGEPVDRELVVVKVTADDGRAIALVWNYAIHGTMLGARNLHLSGDVMGMTSTALERALGVPVLFVNGAVGDVSPRGHGMEAARTTSAALASAVEAEWRRADTRATRAPVAQTVTVRLPGPSLSLRACLGRWTPRSLALPLGGAFPADATLVAAAVGDTAWVAVPGELQSALGAAIKRAGRATFRHALVAGLTNDYLGYFIAPEAADRIGYVTCANLYGRDAGACLVETASALMGRLAPSTPGGGRPLPSTCASGANR